MGDYILREIDRIGQLLRALAERAGALRRDGREALAAETVRTTLSEELGLDVDRIVRTDDPVAPLLATIGPNERRIELLAECLAEAAAADPARRRSLATAALALYRHLELHGTSLSFDRYRITDLLQQYINES